MTRAGRWGLVLVLCLAVTPPVGGEESSLGRLEQRLAALEQELRTLRTEVESLRAAQAVVAPPSPAPEPASPAPAPVETATGVPSAGALPVYGGSTSGKVFNPDIGIIGNFINATGEGRGGTESIAPLPFFSLQESEASLQAVVDPYARADFFLAIGEEGIEVEEGFVTFPALPGGLLVKAGKMRASFGRLNTFHNHTLPWVDRPMVMFNLLGGETLDPDTGIKDAGVSVSRLIPAGGLFVEATGEVFRGESGSLFSTSRRRDFSIAARLRGYGDLTESANLELGGSFARGHNDAGSEFVTRLFGADVTFRWRPLQRALYRSLAVRSELVWSQREEPGRRLDAFGLFASADYQLTRRWFAGARYDWSERAREPEVRDHGFSGVLTFWPSEFAQVRGQYRRWIYGESEPANELFLQVLFTIGAHGAHAF